MKRVPQSMTQRARSLRNRATDAERHLWQSLARVRPRFTRQLVIGAYIADFACRQARLVVELDGSQHVDSATDARRTKELEARGWQVIRFWNSEVVKNVEGVVEAILESATARLGCRPTFTAPRQRTSPPFQGSYHLDETTPCP